MENKDEAKRIKLLICQGGGCRGIISIRFLLEVQDFLYNNPITHYSGTSIGGINILYLARGKSVENLYEDFKEAAPKIFKPRLIKKIFPLWRGGRYPSKNIERFLQECIPGKMRDLKKKVVVPCINFKLETPRIFHNLKGSCDMNYDIWKVGRATSAAPYYFNPYSQDIFIDGGLLENLPLMTSITKIKSSEGIRFENMDIFIIGTGGSAVDKNNTLKDVSEYYPWEWGTKLLLPFTTKSNEIASEHWGKELGFHFFRYFNPVICEGALDDPDLVTSGYLESCCDSYLGLFREEFKAFLDA